MPTYAPGHPTDWAWALASPGRRPGAAEVLRTVVAHFEHACFQLQPFLIIGIVSATWEILTAGARLCLAGDKAPSALRSALLELGVNAGVVLGLATALVLIRRGAGMRET